MIERLPDEEIAAQRQNERCGDLVKTVIQVWDCGDSHCDCSQVEVVEVHRHNLVPRAKWAVCLAKGTFCTDGTGGDDDRPAADVWADDMAEARQMFPDAEYTVATYYPVMPPARL